MTTIIGIIRRVMKTATDVHTHNLRKQTSFCAYHNKDSQKVEHSPSPSFMLHTNELLVDPLRVSRMVLMTGGRPRAQARWGRVVCSRGERGCETDRTPFFSNRASACVCCVVLHNASILTLHV